MSNHGRNGERLVLTYEDGGGIGERTILLNGIDITPWLSGVSFRAEATEPTRVELEFVGVEIRQVKRDDPFYGL